jgi:hypothetical protein
MCKFLPADPKTKLTPYHSKPHLYGLIKTHKPDIPLKPIVALLVHPDWVSPDDAESVVDESDSIIRNSDISFSP